jgi:transcriptional regulator with XRE-family HTH domain
MSSVPEIAEYDQAVATEVRGEAARRQVTQLVIARALGLSQVAVSRRMNGHTPFEVGELVAVARGLGCEVTALLPPQQRDSYVTRQYVQNGNVLQLPPNTRRTVERAHPAPVVQLHTARRAA